MPTKELTPGMLRRQSAYRIDPLLAATVVVIDPHNPRAEEEFVQLSRRLVPEPESQVRLR